MEGINPVVVLQQGKVSVQFWRAAIWYSLPMFTGHQNYCLSSFTLRPSSYLSLKINDSQKFNFGYMFANNRISSHSDSLHKIEENPKACRGIKKTRFTLKFSLESPGKCNSVCVCQQWKLLVILVYAELLVCYRQQFYNVPCYVDVKCYLVPGNFFTMLIYN